MNEKERLLKVATPEQWDCWLSIRADYYAPRSMRRFLLLDVINNGVQCLFCKVFKNDCEVCFGVHDEDERDGTCYWINELDRVDRAIARLKAAGIGDDHD